MDNVFSGRHAEVLIVHPSIPSACLSTPDICFVAVPNIPSVTDGVCIQDLLHYVQQDIQRPIWITTDKQRNSNLMLGEWSGKIGKAEDLTDDAFHLLCGTIGGWGCTSISSPYRLTCGGYHQPRLQP